MQSAKMPQCGTMPNCNTPLTSNTWWRGNPCVKQATSMVILGWVACEARWRTRLDGMNRRYPRRRFGSAG